jgi:hypothetical protein
MIDVNVELRAAQMAFHNVDQDWQQQAQGTAVLRIFQITTESVKKPKRGVRGMV